MAVEWYLSGSCVVLRQPIGQRSARRKRGRISVELCEEVGGDALAVEGNETLQLRRDLWGETG